LSFSHDTASPPRFPQPFQLVNTCLNALVDIWLEPCYHSSWSPALSPTLAPTRLARILCPPLCEFSAISAPLRKILPSCIWITLTPLESALATRLLVLAEIGRSCPALSPLESTLTDFPSVTTFILNIYRKRAGRRTLC
jgi:hypothetical protein